MTDTETEFVIKSANSLAKGDQIKLYGKVVTLTHVSTMGDWAMLYFRGQPIIDPLTKKFVTRYGCHTGFCLEVIKK